MNRINKYIKTFLIILTAFVTVAMLGCVDDSGPATDTFTVTFVDYDGTVLKTIDCTVGDTCTITPPPNPSNKVNCDFVRWSLFESEYASIDRDTEIKAIYTLDNRFLVISDKFQVQFYAFFIMSGMVVALLLGLRESKRIGVKEDDLIDGFLWIVPVAILGARLWYVAFEFSDFVDPRGVFNTILTIIGFENGNLDFGDFGLAGLAIHGAFFTALFCAVIYTRKRKIDIFKVLDIVAVGFIIAQAFGRWGNFFNQEAHGGLVGLGTITDGTAALTATQLEAQFNFLRYTLHLPEFIVNNMHIVQGLHGISDDGVWLEPLTGYYHPTFFYESMINLVGFGIMLVLRRWKKIHFGELLSFYLIWYGGLRIFIETMRTDPLTFDFLGITFKSAIVTSVLMITAGIALSTYIRIKRKGMTYATVPGYFGYKKEPIEETKEEIQNQE